ncbi:MAG: hypothetical protein FJ265_22600, partial [Planctomycetes bacterium]|nr:hypothetical protein [Planctomycetota bacterium]
PRAPWRRRPALRRAPAPGRRRRRVRGSRARAPRSARGNRRAAAAPVGSGPAGRRRSWSA